MGAKTEASKPAFALLNCGISRHTLFFDPFTVLNVSTLEGGTKTLAIRVALINQSR